MLGALLFLSVFIIFYLLISQFHKDEKINQLKEELERYKANQETLNSIGVS